MPCTDYQSDLDNYTNIKNKLDKTTRLLCSLCSKLTNQELFNHILSNDEELAKWWSKHQVEDRLSKQLKEKQERIKKQKERALAKLTPEEKKLLNL